MAQVVTTRTQLGAQLTSVVDTEQTISADLDLRTRYGAMIEFLVNSDQTTPTDRLIARVYLSMDDTVYGEFAWQEYTILPLDTNDASLLFPIPSGMWFVRFAAESAGTTDTYTVDVFEGQITDI